MLYHANAEAGRDAKPRARFTKALHRLKGRAAAGLWAACQVIIASHARLQAVAEDISVCPSLEWFMLATPSKQSSD